MIFLVPLPNPALNCPTGTLTASMELKFAPTSAHAIVF